MTVPLTGFRVPYYFWSPDNPYWSEAIQINPNLRAILKRTFEDAADFDEMYYPTPPTPNYEQYIQSPEWKARARQAKIDVGMRCQLCGRYGDHHTLHVHHNTYENLGHEEPRDLIVLCGECHLNYHKIKRYGTMDI